MKNFLCCLVVIILAGVSDAASPNFVVIFCDDLGYGDLSCFGNPTIKTPHLDRMAAEGQKWTSFYAAASVCTPSRAGLLTGRLPIRSGMCSSRRRVLFPDSKGGLPASEITIAEMLKEKGYATAAVGKWHLGHLPQYLPMKHGFDSYFGIPYSNDMDGQTKGIPWKEALWNAKNEYWNVPLMRDEKIIERPPQQTELTRRYTEESVAFIKQNKDKPFFLYLAHSMPHVPLFRSKGFVDSSASGIYGDVIEEIDWSVGQITDTLEALDIAKNTLVVFTSDNGPWLIFKTHSGVAGPLRDGKGSTWEGGMRVPGIFWWPGKIRPGVVTDMGSTLDLLETFADLAGANVPADRPQDGFRLTRTLLEGKKSPRTNMFFYNGSELYAVRHGDHKIHYKTHTSYIGAKPVAHEPPLLFHLGEDPGERFNLAAEKPGAVDYFKQVVEAHKNFKPAPDQLILK